MKKLYRCISILAVHFKRHLLTIMVISKHNLVLINMNTAHLMDLLKLSSKLKNIHLGNSLQAHLFKSGHQNMLSLQNQLLNVYVKCNEFGYAIKLFDEMIVRNIVTWNTLLCGFSDNAACYGSKLEMGFRYFKRMLVEKVGFDRITFTSLLRMSSELDDVYIGRQLHSFVMKLGLCVDCFVNSALVDSYSKFSLVEDARLVFDRCVERDLVLWNGMMSCYAFNRLAKEAFSLFGLMRSQGVKGDVFTFSNLLKSSILGCFGLGKQVHSLAVRACFDADVAVASTLVDMYAKHAEITNARKIFDGMVFRNVISWNTLIVGYGLNDEGEEALKLITEMFRENVYPDELTLSSVLSSCGNSLLFNNIVQLHCYAIKGNFHCFVSVVNSLINAYSKCGTIDLCVKCFSYIIIPDLVSYSSMIRAYGYHGLPRKSIDVFEMMMGNNILPDQVSFLSVLSACSHGGLVNEGIYYFNLMTRHYQIAPTPEHYACVIDLLGRAGLLNETFTLMTSMSCQTNSDMLGAFIGACKIHGNSKLAKWAENKIFAIEPNNSVNYTLLSNLYAFYDHWVDVARVRKIMREKCDYKETGCSWVEIRGEVYSFVSSDKSHPKSFEIYLLINVLAKLLVDEDCFYNLEYI